MIKQITADELRALQKEENPPALLDVRTHEEREHINIGGFFRPVSDIDTYSLPDGHDRWVVYCRSGGRSETAIESLQKRYPSHEFFNLAGGIVGWVETE